MLEPDADRIFVEYDSVASAVGEGNDDDFACRHGRLVRLDARITLERGQTAEPIVIPLEGRVVSGKVRFERRDQRSCVWTEYPIP